jgi:hypothetical protein
MQRLTAALQEQMARLALACVVAFSVSTSVFAQSTVNVRISLTVDNQYALVAVDPNTNALTLIGSDREWRNVETYSFSAPIGSYIYVIGREVGLVAMFVSRTVFDNSITVLTGVPNQFANWEVNTIYRRDIDFDDDSEGPPTDVGNPAALSLGNPNVVLDLVRNWGGDWQAPAVGRFVDRRETDNLPTFRAVQGARFIWAPPGGGNQLAGTLD